MLNKKDNTLALLEFPSKTGARKIGKYWHLKGHLFLYTDRRLLEVMGKQLLKTSNH